MKKFLFIILIILIAIQFARPAKNIHPGFQAHDIKTLYKVPANVDTILAKACNDCHSNNTNYPWHYNIQPVAWWMNDHVNTAKSEINFNEFINLPPREQYKKVDAVQWQIRKNKMPMPSYTMIHKNAILTTEEKNIIINWAEGIRKQLEAKYPADSLKSVDD
jgi:hypothetical protein